MKKTTFVGKVSDVQKGDSVKIIKEISGMSQVTIIDRVLDIRKRSEHSIMYLIRYSELDQILFTGYDKAEITREEKEISDFKTIEITKLLGVEIEPVLAFAEDYSYWNLVLPVSLDDEDETEVLRIHEERIDEWVPVEVTVKRLEK